MGPVASTLLCAGIAIALGLSPASQRPSAMHDEAARLLADDDASFGELASLADRLSTVLPTVSDSESRGRVALLWVQAMRRTLGKIPMTAAHDDEPFRGWRTRHEPDVIYSEPAGQWLILPEAVWALHDKVRHTSSAEAIAWEAVENGLPGECEGYPPCYISGFTMLEGRYLEAHPAGEHAAQAWQRMRDSLEQIERLLTEPGGSELFQPATDCDDLMKTSATLRTQLPGGSGRRTVDAALDRIGRRCPR